MNMQQASCYTDLTPVNIHTRYQSESGLVVIRDAVPVSVSKCPYLSQFFDPANLYF
jgi:hypothetical protein